MGAGVGGGGTERGGWGVFGRGGWGDAAVWMQNK